MALWYECGNGFVHATFARSNLGCDAYLCCPGPSLKKVNDADLHVPGAMVFAMNTAYPHIRPDVWIGMDEPSCYDRRIWWEPFLKIARGSFRDIRCEGYPIKDCPQTFFADLGGVKKYSDILQRRNHDIMFGWNGNTLFAAIHFMIWMGASTIFLVGCDFGGESDYHDDRKLSEEKRKHNRLLYSQQVLFLKEFSKDALRYNIKFISCTKGSPINRFFEYKSLAEALKFSSSRVVPKAGAVLHSVDANKCQWSRTIKHPKGVMVGVASIHEDLVPWWISNYKRHNVAPIAFADFGMGEDMKALCSQHGQVIDMTDISVEGWFRKPFAILRAPFQKMLWMDLDIEVRGSVQHLFDYAQGDTIGAGHDTYEPKAFRKHMPEGGKLYDSGLLAIEHDSSVVVKWCEMIMGASRGFYFGDHEVLSLALRDLNMPLKEIPKSVHRMRVEGSVDGLTTMHWTGPQGKDYIRRSMR